MLPVIFEFFIFHEGGLIIWPPHCESVRKHLWIVQDFIRKQIMEGRKVDELFQQNKIASLTHYEPDKKLYFTLALYSQIAKQIQYTKALLIEVSRSFLQMFSEIIDFSIPRDYSEFSVDEIVNSYRGKVEPTVLKDQPTISEKITQKVKKTKVKPGFNSIPDSSHITDSIIIKGDNNNFPKEHGGIEIQLVDLDDLSFRKKNSSSNGFLSNIFKTLTNGKVIDSKALNPILEKFKSHLISKNVSAKIASDLVQSVAEKLEGTTYSAFSSIKTIVSETLKTSIERILTPSRSIDLIREIEKSIRPYVIVFVGVNGIGKTTSLAKMAYLFKSYNFSVLISACDTFRNGAIDQLEVHCQRLGIEIFKKEKVNKKTNDPTPIAKESIQYAKERNIQVVLIDTAGRAQNNEGLMKQIGSLIYNVKPDFTLFLAEALVGGMGSEQIISFETALKRTANDASGINGILLTKFDTVDDNVGAALTIVYETGHPIVYLGTGQDYRDLRKMRPQLVVDTLLDGF